MLVTDPFPPVLPEALLPAFATRVPIDSDVAAIAELIREDRARLDPEATASPEELASFIVGERSWSRRQVVVVPADDEGAPTAQAPIAWVSVEDRAAGRVNTQYALSAAAPARAELLESLLSWAKQNGGAFARHRGVAHTILNLGCRADDQQRQDEFAANGFELTRTWLQMDRAVVDSDATDTPAPREGVRVRKIARHESGLPVAQDLRTVHRMIEDSFQDHFNFHRESFAEFIYRFNDREKIDWDLWWIAEVQTADGDWVPAGGLMGRVIPATEGKAAGTYLDYLGVHRTARGKGVSSALLRASIVDAAEKGHDRVRLEVDDASPTAADSIYRGLGFEVKETTQTWFHRALAVPSRLAQLKQ